MHLKMSSAEVVCCKYLPNITDELSIEANSVDPEQNVLFQLCTGKFLMFQLCIGKFFAVPIMYGQVFCCSNYVWASSVLFQLCMCKFRVWSFFAMWRFGVIFAF